MSPCMLPSCGRPDGSFSQFAAGVKSATSDAAKPMAITDAVSTRAVAGCIMAPIVDRYNAGAMRTADVETFALNERAWALVDGAIARAAELRIAERTSSNGARVVDLGVDV